MQTLKETEKRKFLLFSYILQNKNKTRQLRMFFRQDNVKKDKKHNIKRNKYEILVNYYEFVGLGTNILPV